MLISSDVFPYKILNVQYWKDSQELAQNEKTVGISQSHSAVEQMSFHFDILLQDHWCKSGYVTFSTGLQSDSANGYFVNGQKPEIEILYSFTVQIIDFLC